METTRVVVRKTFLTVIANSSSCFKKLEEDWKHLVGSRCRGPQHNHRLLDPIREILMSIWRSSLRKIPGNLCKIANSHFREISLRCAELIFIATGGQKNFPGGVMFQKMFVVNYQMLPITRFYLKNCGRGFFLKKNIKSGVAGDRYGA